MWSERPYTITAFDLDYTRVDFCGRFYVNQVDTEAKQITFTQILDNGKGDVVFDVYLLPSGRAINMGRNRARLFGYGNTQIDVMGFDIVTLKKGKVKRTEP